MGLGGYMYIDTKEEFNERLAEIKKIQSCIAKIMPTS